MALAFMTPCGSSSSSRAPWACCAEQCPLDAWCRACLVLWLRLVTAGKNLLTQICCSSLQANCEDATLYRHVTLFVAYVPLALSFAQLFSKQVKQVFSSMIDYFTLLRDTMLYRVMSTYSALNLFIMFVFLTVASCYIFNKLWMLLKERQTS